MFRFAASHRLPTGRADPCSTSQSSFTTAFLQFRLLAACSAPFLTIDCKRRATAVALLALARKTSFQSRNPQTHGDTLSASAGLPHVSRRPWRNSCAASLPLTYQEKSFVGYACGSCCLKMLLRGPCFPPPEVELACFSELAG